MSYTSVSPTLIKAIDENFQTEKFTNGDGIYDFMDSALSYMKENIENGTQNNFIQEMNLAYKRYGSLTKGQIRGLLNCIRAEVLAADKQADSIMLEMATGKKPLDLRSVPSGRYAVPHGENADGLGNVAFYVIDNIKEENSKWKGWIFVNILKSEEKVRVGTQRPNENIYTGNHSELLQKIVDDPYTAATLYGHLIGRCAMCGRTLTDPESIEKGIGPICAEKVGWFSEYDKAAMKALGFGDLLEE